MAITIEILNGGIEECRELCNELMAFQKSRAAYLPEVFDMMNFDTRMKRSREAAFDSQTILVRDEGEPVGYVFSTIDNIEKKDAAMPPWAPKNGMGFHPDWVQFPQKIGCLSNLYLREGYRSQKLGSKLADMALEWLTNYPDVSLIFTFISNGNDEALDFYLKKGFVYSHEVFGGFIKACCIKK